MKSVNLKLMLVVLLMLFASSCGNLSRAPSDKSMEERFRANEADFNKLIAMLKEDKLFELTPEAAYLAPINNNESPVKTELPAERMEEYRRLLRQTGANRVIGKEKVFNLDFFEGDAGLIFSDYLSKSYVYSEKPISPLFDSLDRKGDLPDVDHFIEAHKKIGDRWYLNLIANKDEWGL